MGAIKKLQPTIIAIFDYVLLFHKFYVSNNFYPLLIKKCLKEVLQNPGNPGHLPLVIFIHGFMFIVIILLLTLIKFFKN